MRIGICDDELSQRISLEQFCRCYVQEKKISSKIILYESCEELLINQQEKIDLLFLDILMDGLSGVQLLKLLEKNKNIGSIVFVSNCEEAVWDVFGKKTLGFERKLIAYERVVKWINVVEKELQDDMIIEFKTAQGKGWIKVEELYYIEAQKNYVKFNTCNGMHLVFHNLKYWEQMLKNSMNLIRVHNAYLVNLSHINSMRAEIYLDNGIQLPIGKSYKKQVLKEYESYILKKIRERI